MALADGDGDGDGDGDALGAPDVGEGDGSVVATAVDAGAEVADADDAAGCGNVADGLAAATFPFGRVAPPRSPPIATAPARTVTAMTPAPARVRAAPAIRAPALSAGRGCCPSCGFAMMMRRYAGQPQASVRVPIGRSAAPPTVRRRPKTRGPMPEDRSAATLIREVGLMADGPVQWGHPIRHAAPGVFVVELPGPMKAAPLDLALIGKWLERVPELTLDGVRPVSKDLLHRLQGFWLPSQTVVLVGSSTGSVAGRLSSMAKTVPGDRKPAWTGFWLHFLRNVADLRIWWAATDAPEEYEDAVIDAFASGVPAAEKEALYGSAMAMPWAVLRSPSGIRKPTGIANPFLVEVKEPPAKPISRIVQLPAGEADGARDEARRARRPAPGRGVGRVASAAAYAAQGSPRKPPPEPVILSPEGLERLQGELDALLVQRPEVIRRIATAREHGDLKENAEYHAAREEQGFLEGRIKQIEAKLKVAIVVAPTERGAIVGLGAKVRISEDGEETVLHVVSSAEADSREGRISSSSPVGAALMGRKVGDAVTIMTPGGQIHYEVLEIS